MLKWKKHSFIDISAGDEELTDILAGMAGKNRVIKHIIAPATANLWIRVYRDAEQMVDFQCSLFTTHLAILPVDIPLVEGQLCKAGFYYSATSDTSPTIHIGYEESA
ncbi:hypothetical protein ES703_113815 [subsurface metagenome]